MKARADTRKARAKEVPKRPAAVRAVRPRAQAHGLAEIYRNTLLSRCLDERLAAWAKAGQLGFHLPALEWGGVLAAAAAALDERDWLFPGAREARMALWRGMGLPAYLAQHLGLVPSADGVFMPAMPGSIADAGHRVASVPGGPAGHLPHAVGAAWAAVQRRDAGGALALCSATALDSPDFHAACNFAGVWRVPVVFAVRWDREGATAIEVEAEVEARAAAYGVAAAHVAGGDLEALWQTLRGALEHGRSGAGATLVGIERPGADGGLSGLRKKLDNGSRPDDAAIAAEAADWCDRSWAIARAGSRPGLPSLTASVYARGERHLIEELADLTQAPTTLPEEV